MDRHSGRAIWALGLMWLGCGGTTTQDVIGGTSGGATTGGTSGAAGSGGTTDTALVCTSGQTWTRGNHGSSSMHPGGACINCHSSGEGPRFSIAGTVYPTAHEPDDCDGVSGSYQVVITDAAGATLTIPVNSVGNFYSTASVRMPFNAKVISGDGQVRAMSASQTTGDCNSCHTSTGANSAPGRIMAP